MNNIFLFLFLSFLLISSTFTTAQSPASAPAAPTPPTVAAAPAPAGPASVITILKKNGRFGIFTKLLESTKVAENIDSQLIDSNNGLTVFAPTDAAFSVLKVGTLNSFTDEQKVEMVQYHVLPEHVSPAQFETASNPLRTQAGGSTELLGMNVTAVGSTVNITTGETNTSVANTVFDDGQLAVYEVGKVLLPMRFYEPLPPPPPAPAPEKPKGKAKPVYVSPVDSSGGECVANKVVCVMGWGVVVMAAFI